MEEKDINKIEDILKSTEEYLKPLGEEAPIWMIDFQKNIKENHIAIKSLYKAYKQNEKVIKAMADFIAYRTDNIDYKQSVIDYFRKKCE